jgi:hypothetical protein
MEIDELKNLVQEIVAESRRLSAVHTSEQKAPVNYACIFTQSAAEYEEMIEAARKLGAVVQETTMGPVFYITPLSTVAGTLRLLKIRRPDPKRPERGYADFTVADYQKFKKTHLNKPGFSIIKRKEMEMIELIDPSYNVIAYYSHPTLTTILNLNTGQQKYK